MKQFIKLAKDTLINRNEVNAVISATSRQANRIEYINSLKNRNRVIDVRRREALRSIVIMQNGTVYLSSLSAATIEKRLNSE